MMGALKAGGAYLPLDPDLPLERLGYMLEDAGAPVVLTERKLEERLPAFGGLAVLMDEEWERISEECESELESKVEAENLAYVIYTSGSTGRPKGVMINHRGLVNYLKWATEAYRIEEGEGAPVQSSIGFDLTVTSLYGPLVNGKRVNLLSEEEGIEALATALSRERDYSLVKLTPAHLEVLAQQMGNSEVEGRAKALVIGGEELKAGALKFWQERAPGTRLINEYGPTETVVGCCVYEVNGSESGRESAPIGKPIANTQMYVLDQGLEPAPIGVRGEICISGAGLGRGYVRAPELTGEKFIPNRFGKYVGERVYRTGDVGRYLSNGNIEFVGRRDDQVKVRGYRIELGEIQAVLEEHRSVRQSVVVVSEDERGGKRLLGYVVVEEGTTAAELKRHVRERLPEYMAPDAILLLEEMPLTANGKIDRKRLPSLKDAGRQIGQKYVAPLTPIEEIVAGVFGEVLKLDRVGREDNFFELGGHSLLATQVISRVRNTFGVEIGVGSIFEIATAEGLASRIEEAIKAGETEKAPPLVRADREGPLPLSFAQQRLWFLDQLVPNNPFYNCPGGIMLEGRLDVEALERSINEIVKRHEILRTRIEVESDEPRQVIDEWQYRRLEVEDLTGLPQEEREEKARRIAREEGKTGFDLSRGPLLRVKVLKFGEEEQVVLFTMHHIVSDEWSMGILSSEVGELYRAYSRGESSPLAELPIQYADFAVWQRNWLQGEALENHLDYWKRQLQGELPVLALPIDKPPPAVPRRRGALYSHLLPGALADSLKALSLKQGCTLFMTLMAAFKTLMYYLTGQTDIIVGTDIANRNRAQTEKLIGFFVNQLVLRTQLSGDYSFEELARKVRATTLGAYAHQDLPFEKLVETINPDRDENLTPLFQVKMALQNTPGGELDLPGLTLSPIATVIETAKFDLLLDLCDTGRSLSASLQYNADLFEERTPARIMRRFQTLLKHIVDRPDAMLRELIDSLIEEDRREELEERRALEGVRLNKLKSARRRPSLKSGWRQNND
jgi:amino acid adenylation domain-containing protein